MSARNGFLLAGLCFAVGVIAYQQAKTPAIVEAPLPSPSAAKSDSIPVATIDEPALVAVATDPVLRLVHLMQATEGTPTHSACFSHDGRQTLIAVGRYIDVRETDTWRQLQLLKGHRDVIHRLRLSPDGKWLASGGDDAHVQIWTHGAEGWSVDRTLFFDIPVYRVEWSPDGRWLVIGMKAEDLRVVDCRTWETTQKFGTPYLPNTIVFSPNGTSALTAGFSAANREAPCLIQHWNPSTWEAVLEPSNHRYGIEGLAWTSDGRHFFSASADMTLRESIPGQGETRTVITLPHALTTMNLLPDDRHVLVSWHFGNLAIVDAERSEICAESTGHQERENSMMRDSIISSDGRFAVTCAVSDMGNGTGSVKLWEISRSADPVASDRVTPPLSSP